MKRIFIFLFYLTSSVVMSAQTSGGQISRPTKKTTLPPKPSNHNVVKISDPDGYINGHGYVDLGLPSGTKWATCNIGADSPSQYGNYFAWGETEPKNVYKYDATPLNGVAVDNISNNEKYDVAKIKWGNGWAIPTKEQWEELIEYCKFKVIKSNGINGILFIGKNGKSIFFSTGGRKLDTLLQFAGSEGYYWSSNADYKYQGQLGYSANAFSTEYIISASNGIVFNSPESRGYGLTIRAVNNL